MLSKAKRIVLKIGSSLLTDEQAGRVHTERLAEIAEDIADLRAQGKQLIIVTSGAVALGRGLLKIGAKTLQLEEKQAAAAAGQIALMTAWREALAKHGMIVAQILLTAEDSSNRRRYLNARNTLETLLQLSAIPIINENDTVATAELRFGDNDRLAARVMQMISADTLVLFSDVKGLYPVNPKTNPDAKPIPEIRKITSEIKAMAGGSGSNVGTGGMVTKLEAAEIALAAGGNMAIASGAGTHAIKSFFEGKSECSKFISNETPASARKRWIASSLHPAGSLVVDTGAVQALKNGKSLLPAGVKAVQGSFERGDAILIYDEAGTIIGRGLTAYSSAAATSIAGRQSAEIEQILGFKGRAALVHRDDLALE